MPDLCLFLLFGWDTSLVGQCISELDIVDIARRPESQLISDVNGSGGAGFVLQASEVRLNISTVNLEIRLVGEGNVLDAGICRGTKHKDPD